MWRAKLKIDANESLRHDQSFSKGSLGQDDILLYSIVNQDGAITGTVKLIDQSSIRGIRRSLHVIQKDSTGKIIVDENWEE